MSAIEEVVFNPLGQERLTPLVIPWLIELIELAGVRKVIREAKELGEPGVKLEFADEGVS